MKSKLFALFMALGLMGTMATGANGIPTGKTGKLGACPEADETRHMTSIFGTLSRALETAEKSPTIQTECEDFSNNLKEKPTMVPDKKLAKKCAAGVKKAKTQEAKQAVERAIKDICTYQCSGKGDTTCACTKVRETCMTLCCNFGDAAKFEKQPCAEGWSETCGEYTK